MKVVLDAYGAYYSDEACNDDTLCKRSISPNARDVKDAPNCRINNKLLSHMRPEYLLLEAQKRGCGQYQKCGNGPLGSSPAAEPLITGDHEQIKNHHKYKVWCHSKSHPGNHV